MFAGSEYPCWVRFSSDTSPTSTDYKSTCGIGLKLFDVPGKKILGLPDDVTFDFILQNFPVFFVNTARDMCEFTRAGVVGGDFQPYLDKHPETARLLDEMAQPVGSVLGIDYWSGVPFAFGPGKFVKYKLEPTKPIAPPTSPPDNPCYLGMEMTQSLQSGETRFRFYVQFQTNPLTMPLDQATVDWSEAESPPVWIAELILPQQDITVRGQANYGENLSYNVWRVTEPHTPQGSLAEARRDVYAASAKLRRDVNGIPAGEPEYPKPVIQPAPPIDSVIVRAAIHPAIGIARVGDSVDGYYIGPEVTNPTSLPPGSYRDAVGALKRQAARFRIYGYNAAGEVVAALNSNSAHIQWTVHLANRKSQWYQFQAAMDVPEAVDLTVPLRNKDVAPADRDSLAIDPGPRSISGSNSAGGNEYFFNTGTFKGVVVPLGEIGTDDHGNLLVLGGKGVSASPNGAPVYIESDPDSFNNANDWYDDISDGPVMASVTINDREIPVESAWVSVAPPNYAPDIIGWRTLYECLVDVYTQNGWLPLPSTVSFTNDILPLLSRLNNLQWVNKGFAALYGAGCPLDFSNPELIAKLAQTPVGLADPYKELRRVLKNSFRPYNTPSNATHRATLPGFGPGFTAILTARSNPIRPDRIWIFPPYNRHCCNGGWMATAYGWWYAATLPSGEITAGFHTDPERASTFSRDRSKWEVAFHETRLISQHYPKIHFDRPLPALDAGGSALDRVTGDGWVACGDAAQAFDPISSQGIFSSMVGGARAGAFVQTMLDHSDASASESATASAAYVSRLNQIRAAYLAHRREAYRSETRWTLSSFWSQQHSD